MTEEEGQQEGPGGPLIIGHRFYMAFRLQNRTPEHDFYCTRELRSRKNLPLTEKIGVCAAFCSPTVPYRPASSLSSAEGPVHNKKKNRKSNRGCFKQLPSKSASSVEPRLVHTHLPMNHAQEEQI